MVGTLATQLDARTEAEALSETQRLMIGVALVLTALIAALGILFLVSATAVDAMSSSSIADSMIVDARSAIFRPGQAPVVE